jgi:hypothetical protein
VTEVELYRVAAAKDHRTAPNDLQRWFDNELLPPGDFSLPHVFGHPEVYKDFRSRQYSKAISVRMQRLHDEIVSWLNDDRPYELSVTLIQRFGGDYEAEHVYAIGFERDTDAMEFVLRWM